MTSSQPRIMMLSMLRPSHNFKVAKTVVIFNAINMMNYLGRFKFSSNRFFNYDAMHQHAFPVYCSSNITKASFSLSFPEWVIFTRISIGVLSKIIETFLRAKHVFPRANITFGYLNRLITRFTSYVNARLFIPFIMPMQIFSDSSSRIEHIKFTVTPTNTNRERII